MPLPLCTSIPPAIPVALCVGAPPECCACRCTSRPMPLQINIAFISLILRFLFLTTVGIFRRLLSSPELLHSVKTPHTFALCRNTIPAHAYYDRTHIRNRVIPKSTSSILWGRGIPNLRSANSSAMADGKLCFEAPESFRGTQNHLPFASGSGGGRTGSKVATPACGYNQIE
jgi:hypothetical protein